jgi:hypothetical protein
MDHMKRTAQHFAKVALHHKAIAASIQKCFGKNKVAKADLEDIDVDSLTEMLQEFLDNHAAIADECVDYAECCAKAAQEDAEKVSAANLKKILSDPEGQELVRKMLADFVGNQIVPTGVRVVVPTVPDAGRSGLVAVPRVGQRSVAAAAPEVPTQFAKLFSVEDEEPLRQ